MSERIERLQSTTENQDGQGTNLFYTGPAEFLVVSVVKQLRMDPQWKELFGENIDAYRRQDYSIRSLPALRVYNETYTKQFESWFIEGDLKADIIFPASIRREETQQLQDSVAAAMLQQFRRPAFFDAVEERCPSLNELGKTFAVDKSLGFAWNDTVVPLTQLTINFRMDLRIWDDHLEKTNRTKDSPFSEVLGDLRRITSVIQGQRDQGDKEIEIGTDQKTK
jgi:hypothetical protein